MQVRTKGNANPKGKSRIFFACHPDDWDRYFDKICKDVFKTHDAAIFYLDKTVEIESGEDQLLDTDLRQMNLFIFPVSIKLLIGPCFAREYALPFAKKEHIPILPIMLEPGLDDIYSYEENFGALQYLDPYSSDSTAITFEKKLSDFLDIYLVGNELSSRIKTAFDAYVFLSYRKKDRAQANSLMHMIHSIPSCRDIAIWYDEFITPGEEFNQTIEEAMKKSRLFTLIVTPNLICETNYVEIEEYPRAKDMNVSILPVEMLDTDRNELERRFPEVPECIKKDEEERIRERILTAIKELSCDGNDDDPEHKYLIGLAYLNGIDVELDRARAVELITKAAESGFPEAMEKLAYMYRDGMGVESSKQLYLKWYELLVNYYEQNMIEEDTTLLDAKANLAFIYRQFGELDRAIEINEGIYEISKRKYGDEHRLTLSILCNLASEYGEAYRFEESIKEKEKAYEISERVFGEEDELTLTCLGNLACGYIESDDKRALELNEKAYEASKHVRGEDHPRTLICLYNLSNAYREMDDINKYWELLTKTCNICVRILEENSYPDNWGVLLEILSTLADTYCEKGDYIKARKLYEIEYKEYCRRFEEGWLDTLIILEKLAYVYKKTGAHVKALELYEKLYESYKRREKDEIWKRDPRVNNKKLSLQSLGSMAGEYRSLGNHRKALDIYEMLYEEYRCKDEEWVYYSPQERMVLYRMAGECRALGDHKKALELYEELYEMYRREGDDSPDVLIVQCCLADEYGIIGEFDNAEYLRKTILKQKKQCVAEALIELVNYDETAACLIEL